MPLPTKKETLKEYAVRFMADPAMVKKYPKEKQRYIVMLSHWQDRLEKMVLLKHLIKIREIYKAARDKYDKMAMKLANQMLGVWDEQTKLAIADTIRSIKGTGPYKKTGPITQVEIKRKLDDISQMMGEDIIGKMRDPVNRFTEEIYFGELTEIVGTGAAFNVIDERAIAWAEKNSMYWIGEHYGTAQSKTIGQLAAKILEEGMDRNAAALYLRKNLGKQFKRSHAYWDLLSNHIVTRSREFGRTSAYEKAGVEYIRISAVIDHRTSLICRSLNGKIIPVSWNITLRDKLINSKNPEDVKKIAPWMKDKEIEKKIVGKKVKDMPKHVGMPPYHAKCRTRTVRASEAQWLKQDTIPPVKEKIFTNEADATKAMQKYLKTLSPEQIKVLKGYTTMDYVEINAGLRLGKMTEKTKNKIATLKHILNNAPKLNKTVLRGCSFGSEQSAAKFLQSIKKGDMFTNNTFWSTSTSQDMAQGFFDKKVNIMFEIKPKNGGSWIDGGSKSVFEKEVLFKPKSEFKMIKHEKLKDKYGESYTKIFLEEV